METGQMIKKFTRRKQEVDKQYSGTRSNLSDCFEKQEYFYACRGCRFGSDERKILEILIANSMMQSFH